MNLTIALPKGRVFEEALELFAKAGLPLMLPEKSRALMHTFRDETGEITVYELRNSDVPIYVDLGVADIGIVGKDVLMEAGRQVYEPLDLNFSHCRISLIRERGATGNIQRIASKFPRITQRYIAEKGITAEVIKLSGNIELAAMTGLAEAVIDIVQTGSTLKANNLEEIEVLDHSSARLIVNRASLKLKAERIRPLISSLQELVKAN